MSRAGQVKENICQAYTQKITLAQKSSKPEYNDKKHVDKKKFRLKHFIIVVPKNLSLSHYIYKQVW